MTQQITNMQTEYKTNPLGMDEANPRFSYTLSGIGKQLQTKRRVTVTCSCGKTVWDSGFVENGETIQIEYEGLTLKPFTAYTWQVEAELENGDRITSDKASFETGFLNTQWRNSQWISGRSGIGYYHPASRLARQFTVSKKVKQARVYCTALGLYRFYINGKDISEDLYTPGWSQYNDHVQYQAYDVTAFLQDGENVAAALLGDGWYSSIIAHVEVPQDEFAFGPYPLFRAEMVITYEDGSQEIIGTDRSWSTFFCFGALLNNDIYLGEEYDGMFEDELWKLPDFKTTYASGSPAKLEFPNVRIVWNTGAPARVVRTLSPVSVKKHESGTWIVDFGANITGVEEICVPGLHPGLCITIRHGEMLDSDGTVYRASLLFAKQTTTVTCGRTPDFTYSPKFTYYGFRYLEISGWPGELKAENVKAKVISSVHDRTGDFSCSNLLLNKLYANTIRSQEGNFLDVPTDCPQRCERFGWTGDAQLFAETALYNFACPEFFSKWLLDLNAAVDQTLGTFPLIAPNPSQMFAPQRPAAAWSDAGIVCPWLMYATYGDTRMFREYFYNMMVYIKHQALTDEPGSIGDHLSLNAKTPSSFVGIVLLSEMFRVTAIIADRLHKDADAAYCREEAERVRKRALELYYTPEGDLTIRTQTAAALMLYYDIVRDETARQKTIDFLVDNITVERDLHLSTGFVGTPILLGTLTKCGHLELAYKLLQQTTYPSWLYPVTQGATTIWERWNGWNHETGFHDPGMNSFNHYAYGAVCAWFYNTVCGIRNLTETAADGRGYRHFQLAPRPGGTLTDAACSFITPYGKIESGWQKKDDGTILWKFTVPCNTTAEIVIPPEYVCNNIPGEWDGMTVRCGSYELVLEAK